MCSTVVSRKTIAVSVVLWRATIGLAMPLSSPRLLAKYETRRRIADTPPRMLLYPSDDHGRPFYWRGVLNRQWLPRRQQFSELKIPVPNFDNKDLGQWQEGTPRRHAVLVLIALGLPMTEVCCNVRMYFKARSAFDMVLSVMSELSSFVAC